VIPMTLPELAAVVGGVVHDDPPSGAGRPPVTVTGPASIDSRAVTPGGLFVAFPGANADGHDHAPAAVAAGAAAVLGSRPVGVPAVVVADPQQALAALAGHVLGRLPEVRVVGITGSQGKTSTKDLLAAVLAQAAASDGGTVATHGSFNNELGLPLTVLRAEPGTRHLVLEMGARGVGHIRALCAVARPHVALVLNVGKAHLGEFGDQERIAEAKGELVEALPDDGVAVLNADDPRVAAMARRTRARILTFGTPAAAGLRIQDVHLDPRGRARFVLRHGDASVPVRLQLVGEHQAHNAAAAAAVALALGVPLEATARVLGTVTSLSRWRMEVHERSDGVTVLNDSYNANPDSVAAALASLVAVGRDRRTVAVLGEMRELGESSAEEHEQVGRLAARLGVDRVLAVGEAARPVHAGACAEGRSGAEEPAHVADNEAALAWLREEVRAGDVVLVKASRGARLDEVAETLLAAGAAP